MRGISTGKTLEQPGWFWFRIERAKIKRRLEFYFGFFSIIAYLKVLDLKLIKERNIKVLAYLLLMTFFIIPYVKNRLEKVSPTNDAPKRYNPYYNYLNYPEEAKYRKDWNE